MSAGVKLFFGAIAVAIIATAFLQDNRQTVPVINALATGASRLTESALGQAPGGRR
jgi:hypothetical protein